MADEHGHYEPDGEQERWVWDKGFEPRAKVPDGEFDPHDPEPVPEPKPKAPKVTPKKADG